MTRLAVFSVLMLLGLTCVSTAQDAPTVLRHDNYLAFHADAGDDVQIAVTAAARGDMSGAPMVVTVIGPDSETALKRTVPLGTSETIIFRAELSGLHVARVEVEWNLGSAEILDRPWALVAWARVPVNICGKMRRQHFFVPEYLDTIALVLSASVTGEGALFSVCDAEGNTVYQKEADFDQQERIEIEVPEGAGGSVWSLTLEEPAAENLYLDDVQIYLGRGLPPYLAEQAEWLEEFVQGDEYQADIITQTIEIGTGGSMRNGESMTLTWEMDEPAEGMICALRLTATDVDYVNEVAASLNGGEIFYIPVTGDAATETFTLTLAREQLVVGENTLTLTQNPGGGSSAVQVRDVQALIGERIREFVGW